MGGCVYNQLARKDTLLDLSLDVNTAVEFTATGAKDCGGNTVVEFDGHFASFASA